MQFFLRNPFSRRACSSIFFRAFLFCGKTTPLQRDSLFSQINWIGSVQETSAQQYTCTRSQSCLVSPLSPPPLISSPLISPLISALIVLFISPLMSLDITHDSPPLHDLPTDLRVNSPLLNPPPSDSTNPVVRSLACSKRILWGY